MATAQHTRMKPTSRAANETMQPVKPRHRDMVHEAMLKYNTCGNYQTIANDVRKLYPNMSDEQVRKRLNELLAENRIKFAGSTSLTNSNCHSVNYIAVPDAPPVYKQIELFA